MTTCALCGFAYEPSTREACAACPLGARCRVLCCPRCGYTAPEVGDSVLVRLFDRLFRREVVTS